MSEYKYTIEQEDNPVSCLFDHLVFGGDGIECDLNPVYHNDELETFELSHPDKTLEYTIFKWMDKYNALFHSDPGRQDKILEQITGILNQNYEDPCIAQAELNRG